MSLPRHLRASVITVNDDFSIVQLCPKGGETYRDRKHLQRNTRFKRRTISHSARQDSGASKDMICLSSLDLNLPIILSDGFPSVKWTNPSMNNTAAHL